MSAQKIFSLLVCLFLTLGTNVSTMAANDLNSATGPSLPQLNETFDDDDDDNRWSDDDDDDDDGRGYGHDFDYGWRGSNRCVAVKFRHGVRYQRFVAYAPTHRRACWKALRRCENSAPFIGRCSIRY